MTTLLQISDTHFGTEQPPVLRALARLVQQQQVDHVLLSGDITQRAREEQFAAARAWLDTLPVQRTVALPGNHDISLFRLWQRVLQPYRLFQQYFPTPFDDDGVVQWQLGRIALVGVRTTRRYRHVQGEISSRQVANVSKRLRALPDHLLRLVAVHQPVMVVEDEERKNLVLGGREACAQWRQDGALGVLGGHIHEPFVELVPPLASDVPPLWAIQSGTAVSNRIRDDFPNSVNLLRPALPGRDPVGRLHNPLQLEQPRWQAERWDYGARQSRFACVQTSWLC